MNGIRLISAVKAANLPVIKCGVHAIAIVILQGNVMVHYLTTVGR